MDKKIDWLYQSCSPPHLWEQGECWAFVCVWVAVVWLGVSMGIVPGSGMAGLCYV